METKRVRLGWAIALIVACLGVLAWPLATGAGIALSVAAVFAGLRAAALAVLILAVVLAAADLRIGVDNRGDGDRSVARRTE